MRGTDGWLWGRRRLRSLVFEREMQRGGLMDIYVCVTMCILRLDYGMYSVCIYSSSSFRMFVPAFPALSASRESDIIPSFSFSNKEVREERGAWDFRELGSTFLVEWSGSHDTSLYLLHTTGCRVLKRRLGSHVPRVEVAVS